MKKYMKTYFLLLCSLFTINSICSTKITLPQKGKFKEYAVLKMIGGVGLVAFGTFLGGKRAIYCTTHSHAKKKEFKDDYYIDEQCQLQKKKKDAWYTARGIKKLLNKTMNQGSILGSVSCIIAGILLAKKGFNDFQKIRQEEKSIVYPVELIA